MDSIISVQQPSETDRAFAAGFFDGEGWLGIYLATWRGSQSFSPRLAASNTDRAPLEWLRKHFGGTIKDDPPPKNPHYKQSYTWFLFSIEERLSFIQAILPYSIVKRERLLILEEFLLIHSHERKECFYTNEEFLRRATLYIQLRDLNRKGSIIDEEVVEEEE